jgi:hypothetical protein
VASGIDIMTEKGQVGLETDLKEKVKNIDQITHVYFFGEIHFTYRLLLNLPFV